MDGVKILISDKYEFTVAETLADVLIAEFPANIKKVVE